MCWKFQFVIELSWKKSFELRIWPHLPEMHFERFGWIKALRFAFERRCLLLISVSNSDYSLIFGIFTSIHQTLFLHFFLKWSCCNYLKLPRNKKWNEKLCETNVNIFRKTHIEFTPLTQRKHLATLVLDNITFVHSCSLGLLFPSKNILANQKKRKTWWKKSADKTEKLFVS